MTPDRPVLVVGAGPTGLTVAALLGQRGIACTVVDRRPEPFPLPRAVHLDDESMRVLHGLGVAQQLTTRPAHGLRLVDAQLRTLAQFDRSPGLGPLGYAQANLFDQPDLEDLLRARVAELDCVTVRTGVELVGINGHSATLREPSGLSTAGFSYLLGCDGAGSRVRELIGAGWRDLGFQERWLVVDGRQSAPLGTWDGVFQVCDPRRAATYMQVGEDRYRWEFQLHPGESASTVDLGRLLRPWTVAADLEVLRRAEYTFRAGTATTWRQGDVLLLGDAAHETPPFIGQGLGLGLRDAANLAWKLAAVLDGASPDLLDTYEAERAPHARSLIRKAIVVGWALTGGQDAAALLRRQALAGLCRFPALMSGLLDRGTPALHRGPLVAGGPLAGALLPVDVDGFALVLTHRPSAEVRRLADALRARPVVASAAVAERMRSAGTTAALVRPDGVVLAAADRHGRLPARTRRTTQVAAALLTA